MERLTYEKSRNRWDEGKHPTKYTSRHTFQEVVTRLAAYEDAMPIERARELAQAKKDGRLVVLPCKVGDIVYRVIRTKDGHGHIAEATVSGLHMGDTERNRRYKKGKEYIVLKVDGNFCAHIDVKQIGKTVFLTREEAEAALKMRDEADNETD